MKLDITNKEEIFLKNFLEANNCNAKTPGELLEDNYSCQTIEDIREFNKDLNPKQISGLLSSLLNRSFIYIEERDGNKIPKSRIAQMTFEPDLYWISDNVLEMMNLDKIFSIAIKGL